MSPVRRLIRLFMFLIGNHDTLPEAWKAVAKLKFDSDRAYREGSRRANAELLKILGIVPREPEDSLGATPTPHSAGDVPPRDSLSDGRSSRE